ncbi:MAG: pilus assembly protein [Deltaproteobacteria bacterium]|nr:pilus assembly protein [Deltaproteobacteria bacterium]
MASRRSSASARDHGQSLVETVIFLPVLVIIFLGMFYLKGLLDTKMRAVEAARYVTWENTWIPREGINLNVAEDGRARGHKGNATLRNELIQLGLGAYLCNSCPAQGVQGTKRKEGLGDYLSRVQPGSAPMTTTIPAVVTQLFGDLAGFGGGSTSAFTSNPDGPPSTGGGSSSGSGALSSLDLGSGLSDILNIVGGAAFTVYGVMGHQTKWGTESDESVLTSQVVYKYDAGGTTIFVPRFVSEQSSILSHPFNIKRSNDNEEHHRLAGDGSSCTDTNNLGHIFDLWLFPSGQPTALRIPKCAFAAIATVTNFLSALNPFSPSVPLRLPNGTLKEYPEMDLPASSGVGGGPSGSGGGTGSGLGGGSSTPPGS